MLLAELILQSDDLETLATNLASVDGTFTHHVENLLVRVRIILDTWAHANDNTPGRVGGEDEHWVVNRAELRVDGCLHLVPLIQLDRVLSQRSAEAGS